MLQEVNSDSMFKLFDLFSVVFVIIIIHKALLQRILPLTSLLRESASVHNPVHL